MAETNFVVLLACVALTQATFLGFVDEAVSRHQMNRLQPDVVFNAGDTIELTCAAAHSDSIIWKYPRQLLETENTTAVTEISLHTTNSDGERVTPYFTNKLIIANASGLDAGEYECSCSGMSNIQHLYEVHIGKKVISKHRVYVYVSDGENLFKEQGGDMVSSLAGISRRSVIVPCAVNNPNTSVELVKEKGYSREIILRVDGKKYSFNAKQGFTISHLALRDSGMYKCRAVDGDRVETKIFLLRVMRSQPLLQKPVIKGHTSVALGMSTILKCHVAVGKHQLASISWWKKVDGVDVQIENSPGVTIEDPLLSTAMCSGNRNMCSFRRQLQNMASFRDRNLYVRYTGRLRVEQADPKHSGSYFCKAWSEGLTKVSNTIDLEVTGPAIIMTGNERVAGYTVVDGTK